MAKSSGLGARLFVDGFNVSGDVGSLSALAGSAEELDVTGIDKEAKERLLGLRDGEIDFTAWWNPGPAANAAHPVLKTLPTADRAVTYAHRATIGAPAASLVGKQMKYDIERADSGALTCAVLAAANGYGRDWGVLATPAVRSDVTATNGAGVDLGAASAFGLQAYVHVLAFTGTSVTIKLQGSSDNGGADAWVDITGGGLGTFSAVGSARVETSRTQAVEQWVRVVTTGTFTSAQFVVMVCRNESA